MLEKQPEKRLTLDQIKESAWLKEGYNKEIEINDLSSPLESRGTTLQAILAAKKATKKLVF